MVDLSPAVSILTAKELVWIIGYYKLSNEFQLGFCISEIITSWENNLNMGIGV